MELEQYAEVLGIATVDAVSEPKVRAAFQRACLELHPLAHGEATRGPALRQFRDTREAFTTLQSMLRKLRAKGKSAQVQEGEMSEGQMIAEDYALRSVMQELQSTEIIIEAKVPFGCPSAVLGLEDDKDWVIDYSPLKNLPTKNPYPAAKDSAFDAYQHHKVFSVLWIASHELYWTIPLNQEMRTMSAFFTPAGDHYQWNMLCKFLPGADGMLQRRVDTALGNLVGKCCVAARERVLVFSDDGDTHMGHLKAVTRKLKALGLLVDSERSGFGFGWAASRKLLDGDTRVGGESVRVAAQLSANARAAEDDEDDNASISTSASVLSERRRLPTSKSSGRKKGKAAVQESEDQKTLRLEREEFEMQMELQRLRREQLRLKRKMLGKRDLGDICKSPLAKLLMLQLGLCLLYYVFVELKPKGEDYEYEF